MIRYRQAATAINNRNELVAEVADRIERDLVLLGATGIEDKLQDVSWSIESLIDSLENCVFSASSREPFDAVKSWYQGKIVLQTFEMASFLTILRLGLGFNGWQKGNCYQYWILL